jgi:hypothetical protein
MNKLVPERKCTDTWVNRHAVGGCKYCQNQGSNPRPGEATRVKDRYL